MVRLNFIEVKSMTRDNENEKSPNEEVTKEETSIKEGERRKKEKLEEGILLARKIQFGLLPQEIPEIKRAKVAFKYVPMMAIGGDFLDIYYDSDIDKLGLFICDVSGHGIHAAFLASMVKMSLHDWSKSLNSPSDTLSNIYYSIKGKTGGNYITAIACCIDISQGKLTCSNAGHLPLIIILISFRC